jgi:hypothetical protein
MALTIQTASGYLDLYGDESISLDYNVADLRDPGVVFSPISQNFTIPATDANNTFFKHYYDVSVSGGFNVYAKQDVSLFADGVNLLDGYLQLLNVAIVDGVVTQYEVLVAGSVGGIARSLGEKELNELGFDDLNHAYTWTNIYDSWTTPIGDAIVYGMVDKEGFATDSVFKPQSILTPLSEADFYPHILVKNLIRRIFLSAGYSINPTDFWESGYLDKLYMLLWSPDTLTSSDDVVNGRLFSASKNTNTDIPNGNAVAPLKLTFNTEAYDPGGNFDLTTEAYTAPVQGSYTFNLSGEILDAYNFRIATYINGVYGNTYWVSASTTYSLNFTLFLNAGVTVELYAAYNGAMGVTGVSKTLKAYTWTCTNAPITPFGATLQVAEMMPKIKQRDFLAGFAKLFNLVVIPDTPNSVNIYDYQTWIADGVVQDWTRKIDISKPVVVQPTTDLQGRAINFNFAAGESIIETAFQNSFGYPHGSLRVADTGNEFAQGDFTVEVPFVSSMYNRLNNAAGIEVLQLFDLEGKAIGSEPRLMWYHGVAGAPQYYVYDTVSPSIQVVAEYPKFGVYTKGLADNICLSFGQTVLDNVVPPFNNLFTKFWTTYVTEIYASDAVMVTAQAVLEPIEVYSLQLNTQVYFDGEYWRINKIAGYDPDKRTCSVELFRASFANGVICTEVPTAMNSDGTVSGLTNLECCEYYGYKFNTNTGDCYWRTTKTLSLLNDLEGIRTTALLSLEPEQPTATQPNEVFFLECNLTEEGVSEEAGTFKVDYARSPFAFKEGQTRIFELTAVVNETGNGTYADSHIFSVERGATEDVVTEIREVAHDHNFGIELLMVDDRVVGVRCRSLKNGNSSSLWNVRMEVQQI